MSKGTHQKIRESDLNQMLVTDHMTVTYERDAFDHVELVDLKLCHFSHYA